MEWICVVFVAAALLYAGDAKSQKDFWKKRCEAVEQGYADRDVIRLVDRNARRRAHAGPALLLKFPEADTSEKKA